MKLYLVRHGETPWNNQNRIQGWIEVGLTDRGQEQIRDLADHFPSDRPFDLAMSTLRRARESASILEQELTVQQQWNLEQFRELNQGHWNGLRSECLRQIDPRRFRRWHEDAIVNHPPGGESLPGVRRRVREGLAFLQSRADHPVIVVAHKVVNSLIAHLAGEWSLDEVMTSLPSNAALYETEVSDVQTSPE